MDEEATEQAETIVGIVRAQNWKNGGALKIDHGDAVGLIAQALRTAYSKGAADATVNSAVMIGKAFDAVASERSR